MDISGLGEIALVEKIRQRFSRLKPDSSIVTGIGDDAAVIKPGGPYLLATTDMMAEHVHFDLNFITPYQLGHKLIDVNSSDIFAMAGSPGFALLSLALPPDTTVEFADEFFNGIQDGLDKYGAELAGGDLSASVSGIVMSLSMIGYADNPIKRSGARVGDKLYVTGPLGDSACGLAILKGINKRVDLNCPFHGPLEWEVMRPLFMRHLMPAARTPSEFGIMAPAVTAMIDLSDGLLIDLNRLLIESNRGARIYADLMPMSNEMKAAASAMGIDAKTLAISGGEDYELLFSAGPDYKPVGGAVMIGEITESGMTMVDGGLERPVGPMGYRHFS